MQEHTVTYYPAVEGVLTLKSLLALKRREFPNLSMEKIRIEVGYASIRIVGQIGPPKTAKKRKVFKGNLT